MPRPLPSSPAPVPAEALGHSLQRLLGRPLTALRASIEALAADLERQGHERGPALEGALDQIVRLARDVETLVELAAPRPLSPLPCTLDEIAHSALKGLGASDRGRVHYARAETSGRLEVDGPLLARCLTYLLQGALEGSTDPVLLSAHAEAERALFSIVGSGTRPLDLPERVDPVADGVDVARAVRTAAAGRDLARMDGRLTVEPTSRGLTCIRVELPLQPQSRPGRRESAR
jgi:K+-sensing histidine kinase KdpD